MGQHDESFYRHRDEAFDQLILLLEDRMKSSLPPVLTGFHEISPEKLQAGAENEVWSLFLGAVRHLKDGAPGSQPGSMTEALSRASLRSSAFAAALGVKPPQFEHMYFSVNYTTGQEAAVFFCRRLAEAAEGDLSKSRQIIQQKLLVEKPAGIGIADAALFKKQMALSFDILAETYGRVCRTFKADLAGFPGKPPRRQRPETRAPEI